jgi:pimeloyl-ACP methyl ester carboxylesterase
MSGSVWNSVTPHLSAMRRVIAFDIAGFGRTPPLPAATPPTSANLASALEETVRAMGLEVPIDIAGNSLGGLIAMEQPNADWRAPSLRSPLRVCGAITGPPT